MKRTDFRGRHIGIELFATVPAAQAGEEDQGTGPLRSVHNASRKTRIPESRRRLPRSLGWIVDVAHFFPIVLFRQEFHRGLEAIDGTVAMLDRVPSTAALACSPTKRSYPTTWRTIAPFFCEGIALISFLIGPTSGKSDVFLLTVGDHCLIDEFPTVIGSVYTGILPRCWYHNGRARSASKKPGRISFHSANVRIGICCFSSVPALVVERPP